MITIFKDRDASMLALCFQKDQLKNFIISLSQIMTIIKTKTSRIFVPSVLQNSPVNPEHDFLVVMRSVDKLDKYFIDRGEDLDENLIAK